MSDLRTKADLPVAESIPLSFEPLIVPTTGPRIDDPEYASSRGKKIGILVVTYNAVTTLAKVLKRIPPVVWDNVQEIAVFDDASADSTYELAVGLKTSRNLAKLKVLRHRKNLGYGGNQKAGYQYFLEQGFDVVVMLHGDGQYAPEILAHLYHPIIAGEADAVFGSRMMDTYGGALKGGMPLYKYVGNRILTGMENRALKMKLTEFHSGYRAYSLAALQQIDFSRMTDDFHFDTEIIIKLQHQSLRIAEVPIPTYYGDEICYVNGMRYAKDVARAVFRYKRTVSGAAKYPEFAEYYAYYPIKSSKGSSHKQALQLVGTGQEVLDIGCGEGFLAELIAQSGNRVTGVDFLETPQRAASLAAYWPADLNHGLAGVAQRLTPGSYTRALFLDVLEHLTDPARLLTDAQPFLSPGARVIVSLPNVANLFIRLSLLFGRFNYSDRGILDRTHVRFFTRKTAISLLEESGFKIDEIRTTPVPVELALGINPQSLFARFCNACLRIGARVWPTLLGYQFVFVASKAHPTHLPSSHAPAA
jgi:glycosyltransferase involved in cell wall biosynthesis